MFQVWLLDSQPCKYQSQRRARCFAACMPCCADRRGCTARAAFTTTASSPCRGPGGKQDLPLRLTHSCAPSFCCSAPPSIPLPAPLPCRAEPAVGHAELGLLRGRGTALMQHFIPTQQLTSCSCTELLLPCRKTGSCLHETAAEKQRVPS